MFLNVKNILVLAPHTDDGELGCGGTIAKFIDDGAEVHYAAFSTAAESLMEGLPKDILKTEVREATAALGIRADNLIIYDYEVRKLSYSRQSVLEDLVKLRNNLNPDLVFMPSLHDIHQDHSTVAEEGLRAFKYNTILGYELPWNNLQFNTQCFIRLEKIHLQRKFDALRAYSSQIDKHYMSKEFIFSLAKTRGIQIGTQYAECYEVMRWVL